MNGDQSQPTSPREGNGLLERPWYRLWPEATLAILLGLVIAGIVVACKRDDYTVVAIRDIAKGAEIGGDDLGCAPLPHMEGIIIVECRRCG